MLFYLTGLSATFTLYLRSLKENFSYTIFVPELKENLAELLSVCKVKYVFDCYGGIRSSSLKGPTLTVDQK